MSDTIILDTDGVLLNWRGSYIRWLQEFNIIDQDDESVYNFDSLINIPGDKSYKLKNDQFSKVLLEMFNQTYNLGKLPPIPGAVKAIKLLHEAGYTLKIVSSYTDQYEVMKMREQNLINIFGNVFQEIVSLPLHSSKLDYLSKQDTESYFIEDSWSNILDAKGVGFRDDRLFLMPAPWNHWKHLRTTKYFSGFKVKRIHWDQITKEILGE